MMSLLCSLLPIAVYLVALRSFDAFSMVRWRTMAVWMLWGVVSAVVTLGVVTLAHQTHHAWTNDLVSPLLEESVKALPLLWLVDRRKIVFLAETQLYGQAIGGGFALFENLFYLSQFSNMTVATALIRGLGTALLHMGCTALIASLLLTLITHSLQLLGRLTAPFSSTCLLLLGLFTLLPSVLIHLLHNVTTIPPATFMMLMLVAFFLLFWLIAVINERGIIRWLDVSLQDDVHLLADLREGRLLTTKAGQYLLNIRSRFQPLVFFDLCVYLQLYLELLIAAKAQVMLRDAGISPFLTPEEKERRQGQLQELQALTQRLPRLALRLLRPLIHATDQDRWALHQFAVEQ